MKQKYYAYVVIVTLLLAGVAWMEERSSASGETEILTRSEPGEGAKEYALDVEVPGLQDTYTYEVSLAERMYTREECDELFEAAKKEIEEGFAAEGEDVSHVSQAVNLVDSVQGGLIGVEWDLGNSGVIREDGSIDASKAEETGTIIQVCAGLSYGEYECLYEFPVCVYPKKIEDMKGIVAELDTYFKEKESSAKEMAQVDLPEKVQEYQLNWSVPKSYTPLIILGMGILSLFLIPLCLREQEQKKQKERQEQMKVEYPGMLAEFSLLLGAGMTVRLVWERLVQTYEKQLAQGRRSKSELYEQMRITQRLIADGAGEAGAYEEFARRCEISCCRRFSMLLVQYLQKGTKGLAETLELEANQAFEERKSLARRRGEEAGTKLLFPMLMMLVVVLIIMLVPACMSMEV